MTSDRPAIEFDHHSSAYAADPFGVYRQLHADCPLGWTENYGGFWVVTRYDDVATIARDDITFSSRKDFPVEGSTSYTGINIPPMPNRAIPIEMDPPDFAKYRRILNPAFSPAAIERLKPSLLSFTTWCLDQVVETGAIDFVVDLANPVPAMATLAFLGIGVTEWEAYATPFHNVVAFPSHAPEHDEAIAGITAVLGKVAEEVAERRSHPRDDLLTRLTEAEVDGERFDDQMILDICTLILGGGVDTTTGLIAHALRYLSSRSDVRVRLLEDSGLMSLFCEEMLRYNAPTQTLARTATRDVELGGQLIREGERLMICWAGANHDELAFDRPEEIMIDRLPNRHAAFGLGAHRCLGSNFTRVEFAIALEQVLRRMPDYELVEGAVRYDSIGYVNGWHRLPARFTPGPRLGATLEPAVFVAPNT